MLFFQGPQGIRGLEGPEGPPGPDVSHAIIPINKQYLFIYHTVYTYSFVNTITFSE